MSRVIIPYILSDGSTYILPSGSREHVETFSTFRDNDVFEQGTSKNPEVFASKNAHKCGQSIQDTHVSNDRMPETHSLDINKSQDEEKGLCVICLSACVTVLPSGCGHYCMCDPCANHPDLKQCPICRKQFTKLELIKVFTAT